MKFTEKLRPTTDSGWTEIWYGDTGNGAIKRRYSHPHYPGVSRCEFRSYCGRDPSSDWYEADRDREIRFATVEAAADFQLGQIFADCWL